MFTKHNIALVVACATLSTACDDYLDMPSYTTTDTETVFSTESAAEAYVLGCYRGLVTTDALYQLAAGDMITHSCEDGTTNNSKYNICNYYYDATTPYTLSSIYSEGYKTIEGVNVGLKGVGKLPESDKSKSLRAELLCQRAFAYWQLINVYGDVPAVWQSLEDMDMSDENTLYPTRASRDEIYDQIVSDLQWAAENLQWFEESGLTTTERLCKNSALALLAKVAMHAAGYSLRWDLKTNDPATLGVRRRSDEARVDELYAIARDACRQIIEHGGNELIQNQGTMSGFHYLWYNFCQRNLTSLNREIMWSLAELGSLTNSKFGLYAHPGSSGGTFGSRKSLQCLLPTYYLSFDSADTRRDVTCATYSIYPMDDVRYADEATTYSCVMAGKFRLHWCVEPQEASKRNLNIPLIRYSDVLLMFAEADNYLNGAPTADAQKALRQVRERAGIGDKEIPTTKEDFDDAVLQERYWEFGSELFNRFEINRMGLLAREVRKTQEAMKALSDRNDFGYRLYKLHIDSQTYGDPFLALDYIDITDKDEQADIADISLLADKKKWSKYRKYMMEVVRKHRPDIAADDTLWYLVNLHWAYTQETNRIARTFVGFNTAKSNDLNIGTILYQQPTMRNGLSLDERDNYPSWIATDNNTNGIYYGFRENHSELLPFACKSAGHPMIDNPRLTQLPGY